jgi:hypothetical protein
MATTFRQSRASIALLVHFLDGIEVAQRGLMNATDVVADRVKTSKCFLLATDFLLLRG